MGDTEFGIGARTGMTETGQAIGYIANPLKKDQRPKLEQGARVPPICMEGTGFGTGMQVLPLDSRVHREHRDA